MPVSVVTAIARGARDGILGRNAAAACRFFNRALATAVIEAGEVVTGQAAAYLTVLEQRLPNAGHRTERYGNRIEAEHGH